MVTWFPQSVVLARATVFSITSVFELQSSEIIWTDGFADWIEVWEFNGWASSSVFVVWWGLTWNAFDAIRFATFGAWRVDNSELSLFASDLDCLLFTWTLFLGEQTLVVFSDASVNEATSFEGGLEWVRNTVDIETRGTWRWGGWCLS